MPLEKSEENLLREIAELDREKREIDERLRKQRGPFGGGGFKRNFPAAADRVPVPSRLELPSAAEKKPRLMSAVVKVEGAVADSAAAGEREGEAAEGRNEEGSRKLDENGNMLKEGPDRASSPPTEPRVTRPLDSKTMNRHRKMFGSLLLGTLERFRKEEGRLQPKLSKRAELLEKAELRAKEESERLRVESQKQREEQRRRDEELRARLLVKAEEKELLLLMRKWRQNRQQQEGFFRTKSSPKVFFCPRIPFDDAISESLAAQQETIDSWQEAREAEVKDYIERRLSEQLDKSNKSELKQVTSSVAEAEIEEKEKVADKDQSKSIEENGPEVVTKQEALVDETVSQEQVVEA